MTYWRPIETAPTDERVLVCNDLWDMTFGAVQIAASDGNTWQFESGMNIDDLDDDDLSDGVRAEDYQPLGWAPLPNSLTVSGQAAYAKSRVSGEEQSR